MVCKWYCCKDVNALNHDTSKNSHAYLGKRPYQEKSSEQVKEFVCHDRGHLDIPPLCTESIAEVLIRCWNYYPEHRPTFEILLEKIEELLDYKEEFQAIACHDECDLASNQNTTQCTTEAGKYRIYRIPKLRYPNRTEPNNTEPNLIVKENIGSSLCLFLLYFYVTIYSIFLA